MSRENAEVRSKNELPKEEILCYGKNSKVAIDEKKVRRIIDILKGYGARKIGVFGSRARED